MAVFYATVKSSQICFHIKIRSWGNLHLRYTPIPHPYSYLAQEQILLYLAWHANCVLLQYSINWQVGTVGYHVYKFQMCSFSTIISWAANVWLCNINTSLWVINKMRHHDLRSAWANMGHMFKMHPQILISLRFEYFLDFIYKNTFTVYPIQVLTICNTA